MTPLNPYQSHSHAYAPLSVERGSNGSGGGGGGGQSKWTAALGAFAFVLVLGGLIQDGLFAVFDPALTPEQPPDASSLGANLGVPDDGGVSWKDDQKDVVDDGVDVGAEANADAEAQPRGRQDDKALRE